MSVLLALGLIIMIRGNLSAQEGLLANWRLDEESGNLVLEQVRGISSGTLVGSPMWRPYEGIIRGALDLGGPADGVRIPDETRFNLTQNFTISAWIKQEEGDVGWIMLRSTQGSDLRRYYGILSNGLDNRIEFHYLRHYSPEKVTWNSIDIAGDGRWHNIVIVLGVARADLYVDRAWIGTRYLSIGMSGWREPDPVPEMLIGMRNEDEAGEEDLSGLVDDLRIYDNALTEEYIATDFSFAGGSGTDLQPFRVFSLNHLRNISENMDLWESHFLLMNDIDMCGPDGPGHCAEAASITDFWGVFDGGGHSITNLVFTSIAGNEYGFFGKLFGTVHDLVIELPVITSNSGSSIGGLAGYLGGGTISRCAVTGGSITGSSCIGGLVGSMSGGSIEESYSTASVTGNELSGGLAGNELVDHATVWAAFWDIELTGIRTSAGGSGKTTTEMMDKRTYTAEGWNFSTPVWAIADLCSYPWLLCFNPDPGQPAPPGPPGDIGPVDD